MKLQECKKIKIYLIFLHQFGGIEYKSNRIKVGDIYAKVYTIIKYPQSVKIGWLSNITNIPNTICSLNFLPTDNTLLIQNISKGVRQNESIVDNIKDEIIRQRTEREIEDGHELIKRIDQDGEIVGYMSILIMVIAENEEELQKNCKKIESKLIGMQMKIRNLANLVMNAFKSITPFNILDEKIRKIANRNVPLSTFLGGMHFASNRLQR